MGTTSIGLIAAVAASAAMLSDPFVQFANQARVLVISAPVPSDQQLRRQDHNLASFSAEMNDRDLVVVHAIGAKATDTRADTLDGAAVRRAVGLAPDQFGVALVGKDGGVKQHWSTPITVVTLFHVIDAMPMRRKR